MEDAPAGIKAGIAAGCKVIGLVTSHTLDTVLAAGPTWVVRDLTSVRLDRMESGQQILRISDTLAA